MVEIKKWKVFFVVVVVFVTDERKKNGERWTERQKSIDQRMVE